LGFFKKKKNDDISLEDAIGDEKGSFVDNSDSLNKVSDSVNDDNSINNNSKDVSTKSGFKMKDLSLFASDIERLKAQSEANSDIRRLFDERFNRINEQIGELRSMMIERERQISDIDVKATKASDLVSAVQPEQLMSEVKREDVKVETNKAKLESFTIVMDKFREEMNSLRQEMSKFKGLKETLKLNDEVKVEINNIKKALAMADKDANQVEDIFVQVQKNYNEFMKFKTMVSQTSEILDVTRKEFDNMKTKLDEYLTKKDFEENSKVLISGVKSFEKKKKDIDSMEKKVKTALEMLSNAKTNDFISKMNSKIEIISVSQESLKDQMNTMNKLFETNLVEMSMIRQKLLMTNDGSIKSATELHKEMEIQVNKVEELAAKILKSNLMIMDKFKHLN
jgi:hypothetical protein